MLKEKIKRFFIATRKNGYKPRLFTTGFLFTFLVVIFGLRIAFLPFYIPFSRSFFFSEVISTEIVDLLNHQRMAQDLPELDFDPKLARAAELKAEDMLQKDYFAHKSPEGLTGWYFINQVGYKYRIAGENLAIGFLDSKEVHTAWNNSPLHKRNLLDERFSDIGIAVATGEFDDKTTTVVVQLFGTPAGGALPTENEGENVLAEQTPAEVKDTAQEQTQNENSFVEPETTPDDTPQEQETEPTDSQLAENNTSEEDSPVEGENTETSAPDRENGIQEEPNVGSDSDSEKTPVTPLSRGEKLITSFFVKRYNLIAQKTVLAITAGVGSLLLLNIVLVTAKPLERKLKLQILRHLALEGGSALAFLFFLSMVNKVFILQLLPHVMRI